MMQLYSKISKFQTHIKDKYLFCEIAHGLMLQNLTDNESALI